MDAKTTIFGLFYTRYTHQHSHIFEKAKTRPSHKNDVQAFPSRLVRSPTMRLTFSHLPTQGQSKQRPDGGPSRVPLDVYVEAFQMPSVPKNRAEKANIQNKNHWILVWHFSRPRGKHYRRPCPFKDSSCLILRLTRCVLAKRATFANVSYANRRTEDKREARQPLIICATCGYSFRPGRA